MMDSNVQPSSGNCLDGHVAILWDMENCSVPSAVRPEDVAGNIRMALREHHPVVRGAVTTFSAYGDFNGFTRPLREGCQRTGVKLIDVPNGRKDAVDKAILIDMFLFALDNPPPSSIMLISGDVDFAPALHVLGQRGYTVILVVPSGAGVSSALRNAGAFVWDWPSVARGEGLKTSTPPREEAIVYRGLSKRKSGVLQKRKEVLCSTTARVERRAKRQRLSHPRRGPGVSSGGRTSRLGAKGSMRRPKGNRATSSAGLKQILKDSPQPFKCQLHTYCQKRNLAIPVYSTTKSGEDHLPVFTSIVKVGGKSFRGRPAKTKKDAELSAAKTAFISLKQGVLALCQHAFDGAWRFHRGRSSFFRTEQARRGSYQVFGQSALALVLWVRAIASGSNRGIRTGLRTDVTCESLLILDKKKDY